MTEESTTITPMWYWFVACVALIWNLFGVMAYYMQVSATPEQLAEVYNAEQVALLLAVPAWATSATAIATNGGALACILLLLRKSLALPVFVVSLIAIVVQDIYLFGLSDSIAKFGNFPLIMQSAVLVIAIALVWYSRSIANRYYR